jgi:hypothetical protein
MDIWQMTKSGWGGYGTPPFCKLDRATRCAKFPTNNLQKILKKNFISYFP